jgi:formylglycine-generating enzyme required for sulfatase activity
LLLLLLGGGFSYLYTDGRLSPSHPGGIRAPDDSTSSPVVALETSKMVPIRNLLGRNVWIDEFEVTVQEFSEIMGSLPQQPKGFGSRHPVVNVSHRDAETYASRVSKRLCTEEEWRTATGTRHEFSRAVAGRTSSKSEEDVPQDRAYTMDKSETGAYNLLGNVSEWIASLGRTPQYMGSHWSEPLTPEVKRLAPNDREGGKPAPFIGFRCCADIQAARSAESIVPSSTAN